MFKLRPYQDSLSTKGLSILKKFHILYLAMEVRTGKTFTSLSVAEKGLYSDVLFITKKKAIQSIKDDYYTMKASFDLTVINYESLHKLDDIHLFDLIIVDEAHRLGGFPKVSKNAGDIYEIVKAKDLILLSGTPSPESYSQIYHQLWISDNSPFEEASFYKWSKNYVDIQKKRVAYGREVNDYSNAYEDKVKSKISHLMLKFSQEGAGFKGKVVENILTVRMQQRTYNIINKLKKDKVIEGKSGVILADTPVKEMQKVHQLSSGTIKLDDGKKITIDTSKAEFIKKHFNGKKIAIFYKFTQEYEMLKEVFGSNLTNDLNEFNSTNKNIALQVVSGREGISLKKADELVMFNIDFSAVSYWQSRDRMSTQDREVNLVNWIFAENGIEWDIYKAVSKKKSFTKKYYLESL